MTISAEDRSRLLSLARSAVEAFVRGRAAPPVKDVEGILAERRGCFVTLTNAGRLRGCIGTFSPSAPLGEMIVQMGGSAAQDPRFVADPITPAELPQLTVEVSVLSPLEKTDHPEQLEIGTHGIYIVSGCQSGCFLPEVATDHNMGVTEFLDTCCQHKAGLPAGAWKNSDTDVYLFTSEKFSE
jgi:AmmeMemoRadiSam system protein A